MNCPTTNRRGNRSSEESGLQTPPTKIGNRSSLLQKKKESRVKLAPTSTSPYFFIEKTTKTRDVYASQKSPFGCMLFNNFNIYCLKNV